MENYLLLFQIMVLNIVQPILNLLVKNMDFGEAQRAVEMSQYILKISYSYLTILAYQTMVDSTTGYWIVVLSIGRSI